MAMSLTTSTVRTVRASRARHALERSGIPAADAFHTTPPGEIHPVRDEIGAHPRFRRHLFVMSPS